MAPLTSFLPSVNRTLAPETGCPLFRSVTQASAVVGVIGQGYVGLPLGLVFCEAGFRVVGFDVDARKVTAISRGESFIKHIGPERVAAAVKSGRYAATTDFDRLGECDAIMVCVPTPLGKHREPDNSYIHATGREIAKRLRKGQLVVLESTTYPGTTDEDVQPILEATGLKTPDDFLLAFSPEREDPGNPKFHTRNTPKVMGGITPACSRVVVAIYQPAIDRLVPVSSPEAAELAKLLENTFRSVNIGLVNEMAIICDKLGVDVWEVIEAAATKPFGFMKFTPGPGVGGHCIPLDPHYLAWKMRTLNYRTRFIEVAGEVNSQMPEYWVEKVTSALNQQSKAVKGAKLLVIGVAYKPDIDDLRESPAMDVIRLLQQLGGIVEYHDPFIPEFREDALTMKSVPLSGAVDKNVDGSFKLRISGAVTWA